GSVLPEMISRGRGHIVAIASIASVIGLPRMGTYCASKAAVVTQMNALAVDLKPLGIRVSTVCPGFIETPLIKTHNQRLLIFKLSEDAANRIIAAIERGKRISYFPWQTYWLARLGALLPFGLYARLMRRITNRARQARLKNADPINSQPG
ncbi:MAG: SDR family NAD(P)-dependent oxidoreductase, partial [Phycisphaerales bacterium]|nr:SDR family NAD(P)-dependent oxidoreductase [Phycisphaerales bacterium]